MIEIDWMQVRRELTERARIPRGKKVFVEVKPEVPAGKKIFIEEVSTDPVGRRQPNTVSGR